MRKVTWGGGYERGPQCACRRLLVNPHQEELMSTGGEMPAGEETWAEEEQEHNKLF